MAVTTFMAEMCPSERIGITTTVLEWLGYDNEQERDRKQTFLKLLKSNEIDFRQIKHTDPDFDQYPEFVAEAAQLSSAALKSQKWIILFISSITLRGYRIVHNS